MTSNNKSITQKQKLQLNKKKRILPDPEQPKISHTVLKTITRFLMLRPKPEGFELIHSNKIERQNSG